MRRVARPSLLLTNTEPLAPANFGRATSVLPDGSILTMRDVSLEEIHPAEMELP
jgi:hypothetical protein